MSNYYRCNYLLAHTPLRKKGAGGRRERPSTGTSGCRIATAVGQQQHGVARQQPTTVQ